MNGSNVKRQIKEGKRYRRKRKGIKKRGCMKGKGIQKGVQCGYIYGYYRRRVGRGKREGTEAENGSEGREAIW